jgi:hypothetical protein
VDCEKRDVTKIYIVHIADLVETSSSMVPGGGGKNDVHKQAMEVVRR